MTLLGAMGLRYGSYAGGNINEVLDDEHGRRVPIMTVRVAESKYRDPLFDVFYMMQVSYRVK
jgi:hypothetical protein